jgi:hypothetical protein
VWFVYFVVASQYTKTKTAASSADFTTSSNFRSPLIGSLIDPG